MESPRILEPHQGERSKFKFSPEDLKKIFLFYGGAITLGLLLAFADEDKENNMEAQAATDLIPAGTGQTLTPRKLDEIRDLTQLVLTNRCGLVNVKVGEEIVRLLGEHGGRCEVSDAEGGYGYDLNCSTEDGNLRLQTTEVSFFIEQIINIPDVMGVPGGDPIINTFKTDFDGTLGNCHSSEPDISFFLKKIARLSRLNKTFDGNEKK